MNYNVSTLDSIGILENALVFVFYKHKFPSGMGVNKREVLLTG